jgi:HEAT repeats
VARAIDESRPIRELAGNPLLLTILAIIGKHQELPRERWRLYDHAATVLVEHWDVNRHLRDARIAADFISAEDRREILRRVAYRMQAGATGLAGNHLRADELADELQRYLRERYQRDLATAKVIAAAMIDQFRERNFILSRYGAEVYGFVHRAFLEFFCAESYIWRFEKTQELSLADIKEQVFRAHWQDESWREVLRLVVGMIAERFAASLISFLLTDVGERFGPPRHLGIAAQCLSEIQNVGAVAEPAGSVLHGIIDLLEGSVGETDTGRDDILEHQIIPSVSGIGVAWPGRELYLNWFETRGRRIIWSPVSTFVGRIAALLLPDSEAVRRTLASFTASGSDWRLRSAGVEGLALGWREHPETLPMLQMSARSDFGDDVRDAAVRAIANGWRRHAGALSFLRERVTADYSYLPRRSAVKAITEGWREDPDTLPLLRDRATNDVDEDVREAALHAMAEGWPEDPGVLETLRTIAVEDSDPTPRSAAIEAIAEGWREDPGTLPLLRDRALSDVDEDVRAAALHSLAEGWRDEPELVTILRLSLESDGNSVARVAALEELANTWSDDIRPLVRLLSESAVQDAMAELRKTALSILARDLSDGRQEGASVVLDRAIHDRDGDVRRHALRTAVSFCTGNPETILAVRERARIDADERVRTAGLSALAEGWPEDPATLPFLRTRAVEDPHYTARRAALTAIARKWRDHAETLALVRERSAIDADEDVRAAGLSALAEGWPEDPATLPFLRTRAVEDPHYTPREAALRAVAIARQDDAVLAFIQERATADAGDKVRMAGIEALAQASRDQADTLAFLLRAARESSRDDILPVDRKKAVELLSHGWRNSPDILAILRDIATNDKNIFVREEAIKRIAECWRDDPDTLAFLHGCATPRDEDSHYDPDRIAALLSIADDWHRDSRTLPLLMDRAERDVSSDVRKEAVRLIGWDWACFDPVVMDFLQERAGNEKDEDVLGQIQFHLNRLSQRPPSRKAGHQTIRTSPGTARER